MIWEGPGWLGGCWLAARAAGLARLARLAGQGDQITHLVGGNLMGSGGRQSTNLARIQATNLQIYQATKLQATRLIRTT